MVLVGWQEQTAASVLLRLLERVPALSLSPSPSPSLPSDVIVSALCILSPWILRRLGL